MWRFLLKIVVGLMIIQTTSTSETSDLQPEHRFINDNNVFPSNPPPDLPRIKTLNVKCEKNRMRVFLEFDRPFHGMVFSKGHFAEKRCMHLPPSTGRLHVDFEIGMSSCGLVARSSTGSNERTGSGAYIENTVIVQYDPLVQEVWDQARQLRCTWYDFYEKSVAFKPFDVDSMQAVEANFLGDNLQCWMQIQAGKGPLANEVSGIVKIGQPMTMVLAVKDEENKFDMFVRNCVAHDGKRAPIQLVDENGCVVRPKVMGPFTKQRNFGSSASVVSYAHFQAFKFPDSMEVFFQCVIQVCRDQCPQPQCPGGPSASTNVLPTNPFPNEKVHMVPYPYPPQPPPIPAPVPVPLSAGYTSIGRVGVAPEVDSSTEAEEVKLQPPLPMAGPRSVDSPMNNRSKRSERSEGLTTTGHLRVVAPGDLAFNLVNETVVVTQGEVERSNAVCFPMATFVAVLVVLLFLLCMVLLATTFLYLRLRTIKDKERAQMFQ